MAAPGTSPKEPTSHNVQSARASQHGAFIKLDTNRFIQNLLAGAFTH